MLSEMLQLLKEAEIVYLYTFKLSDLHHVSSAAAAAAGKDQRQAERVVAGFFLHFLTLPLLEK